MPYNIQHKSHNSCLIKYTKGNETRGPFRINLSVIIFAGIALMIGVDFAVIIIGYILFSLFIKRAHPSQINFEIDLNRRTNQISVRKSNQVQPKTTTYPLDQFKGFGFKETSLPAKSKGAYLVSLFFKLETSKGLLREAPIQKHDHPVLLSNALKIVEEIDDWLAQTAKTPVVEDIPEPEQEAEILRDFRDVD